MANGPAAVVLCAGKGTRMKSEQAKVLHPLLGRPLCAWPIAAALEAGSHPIVAVVGHQGDAVSVALRAQFGPSGPRLAVQERPLGTADAVRAAAPELRGAAGPVLILYGDTPLLTAATLRRLLDAFRTGGGPLALVSTLAPDPSGYGRLVRKGERLVRIVEERDCTERERELHEVNAGVYAADPGFLWTALEGLKPSNAQGEYYLTDLVALAAEQGPVSSVSADFEEMRGVNDRADLAACGRVLRQRINHAHLLAGVTLEDPESTLIEAGVEVGADTVIEPGVSLRAGSRVGPGARIGQGAVLVASEVGEGTEILAYCVLQQSRVGPRCVIGPFARLRPGSELAEGVHLGNFVETKKTRIGRGSKANHLSYLGDAEVGAGVNVGAGTITCNYDGAAKYPTEIGDGAFIGSDTQLVAPVRIGARAYVAAGTTVTEDVPEDALVLSRTKQVVKDGWAKRRRERLKGKR
ncbi:MAG TPA: bifunctional UDP-N-acetylglucosamine diphosphorylase/glucosamine-1-phosphate N-acetyltransferase GlmU [Myxococcaceae bacterium]|nr:bifunctional UDP-N-acetylglucosamine diphosphorylase/glucosamine-1-phosphate N-acetyltransferase GlmU [Myxococcaceae bacterium]